MVRAVGLGGRVRAVTAVTTATVEELRRIHDPSPSVTAAIGRLATAALLLAAGLEKETRREPVVTVEVDGGGPAGRLTATASPRGWVRAMARRPRAVGRSRLDGKLDVAGVVGRDGDVAVTRDPGFGEPYRGVVRLVSGELAKDIAVYLTESEQTPSAVLLGVFAVPQGRVQHAGGLLVEVLPGVRDDEAEELADRVRELGTITARLREGDGPRTWLARLFPEGCQVLGRTPIRFLCGCSMDRVERALKLLGASEIDDMIRSEADPVTVECQFCHQTYEVLHDRLLELLEEVDDETGGRSADLVDFETEH